ncbi:hypothetical protein [Christiangramia sp. SM2212]|uniref:Uncharacterized protein n=1 Tax=Christiangramia sediminicola TaxID=3073267 RepID=A0ABU1ESR8_9FLAO|nr:hypothetical protein [Christiangramia sp. SM2212]MDR5591208.1 hypothetical protein [Christiangramia sp. SM2212]
MRQLDHNEEFLNFVEKNNIGRRIIDNDLFKSKYLFSVRDLAKVYSQVRIIDASNGGLIEGNKTDILYIYILQVYDEKNYVYEGEIVLPGFYITSYKSFPLNKDEYSELESNLDNLLNPKK